MPLRKGGSGTAAFRRLRAPADVRASAPASRGDPSGRPVPGGRNGRFKIIGPNRGATTRVAPIGANLRCNGAADSPLPLVGRGRGWGSRSGARLCPEARPPTPTLPHKGGGSRSGTTQRKLAPMRVAPTVGNLSFPGFHLYG